MKPKVCSDVADKKAIYTTAPFVGQINIWKLLFLLHDELYSTKRRYAVLSDLIVT